MSRQEALRECARLETEMARKVEPNMALERIEAAPAKYIVAFSVYELLTNA